MWSFLIFDFHIYSSAFTNYGVHPDGLNREYGHSVAQVMDWSSSLDFIRPLFRTKCVIHFTVMVSPMSWNLYAWSNENILVAFWKDSGTSKPSLLYWYDRRCPGKENRYDDVRQKYEQDRRAVVLQLGECLGLDDVMFIIMVHRDHNKQHV